MSKSVIEKIYFCDRAFCDENPKTDDYETAKKEFMAAYEKLLDKLPNEFKDELDDVFFLHTGVADAGYAKKFKDGFELGFWLAAEIYANKDN